MVEKTLANLAVGDTATIRRVGGERGIARRLSELGLLPGTLVRLVRRAPLGDPLELAVRGTALSIRALDAHAIVVESA